MDEIGLSYLSWTPSVRLLGQDTTCVVLVQQNHLVRRDDLVHLGYQTGIGEGASSRVPDPPLLLHFTPNPPSPRPTDYDARVGRRPKPRRDDLHQAPRPFEDAGCQQDHLAARLRAHVFHWEGRGVQLDGRGNCGGCVCFLAVFIAFDVCSIGFYLAESRTTSPL